MNRVVPRGLQAICLRALEKAPTERFQTARDLATALEDFVRDSERPSRVGALLGSSAALTVLGIAIGAFTQV